MDVNISRWIKVMPPVFCSREGQEIAARFVVIGTAACLVSAMLATFDGLKHSMQDQLYGVSFLRMPIDAKTQPGWSGTTWAHVLLDDGIARARRDMSRGEMKYYLYGLTSVESTTQTATLLAAHSVKLELAGCETGTPKYLQNMRYNDYIQSKTSLNVFGLLRNSTGSRDRRGRAVRGAIPAG